MEPQRYRVEVGPVAHGGHCVARVDGRAVFVRHALPGERVVIEVTEGEPDDRFWRADAVEVLEASPDRVAAPCPLAHPDGCGGCDFQHVALPAQRQLKATVVAEQLRRLAGIERDVDVEAVAPTLRWRTRMQYVGLPGGRHGLRKHRSHEVVEVADCLIAAPDARVSTAAEDGARRPSRSHRAAGVVVESVLGRDFKVAADGFWQVHPEAPRVLVETVLAMLAPRSGERALDLYAGVGLFSAFLAEAVGRDGGVVSVEGGRRASELAGENLADLPQATVRPGRVDRVLARDFGSPRSLPEGGVDVVVLDPPREGAKRRVVEAIARLAPRAVAYVACDPAALARDVAYFRDCGYQLVDLRAFDLFPMTSHVECVALLEKTASEVRWSKLR